LIENLTPEQEALLPVYRDKWLKIGLSTEPLDFEKAKKAAVVAYKKAGLSPPGRFAHCQSPLSGAIMAAILKDKRDSVRASFRSSIWDSVWDSVGASVWASVRDSVWDSVRASVRASIWDSVWDSVGASIWDSVRASGWASVWDSVWDSVYGCHDAHWLGFYNYFGEALGVDTSKLNGLMELAKHCGWWIPYENACILQDRPSEIHWDEQNRLHNEAGQAIAYRDGWGIYLWHGVRVPEYVIMRPETITPEDIHKESNAEIRRVKTFRYGLLRYIADIGAECVQSDGYGDLYEIRSQDGVEKFVKVINGTPEADGTYKDYILPTWAEVQTAHEAVARSYNRSVEEYAPEIRT